MSTKETNQQKQTGTNKSNRYEEIIVTIILAMNITCLLGVMTAMIVVYSELKNVTYPGCCGLIESNEDEGDCSPIPGSPTECTMNVIEKYGALDIQTFVVDNEPIYYCSVITHSDVNATICNFKRFQEISIKVAKDP
eukprot:516458_1